MSLSFSPRECKGMQALAVGAPPRQEVIAYLRSPGSVRPPSHYDTVLPKPGDPNRFYALGSRPSRNRGPSI